jgi:N-carbamoyl-L-amino-acid hydrolase
MSTNNALDRGGARAGWAIDEERLRADILELGRIGRDEADRGLYRTAFSEADLAGRRWLMERIREAGLEAEMDGAGNVLGRSRPASAELPSVLVGSHLETVPCGGALDGALGVPAGLESLRTIHERKIETHHPIELVAFSDEEGRFGAMFGAQAFIGDITPESIQTAVDVDGIRLADEMGRLGLDPLRALDAWRDPETVAAYLELHVEQGPVLEKRRRDVGIVEGIAGLFKWQIRLRGTADHEGTTPMDLRNDAFLGLADFAHEIPRVLDEIGSEQSRATIGKVELEPGFPHTIAGEAMFTLVVRDGSPTVLDELESAFRKTLSAIARRASLMFEFDILSRIEPTENDPEVADIIERSARAMRLESQRMYSGAGHDAQFLGRITRTGMIFVPSKGGVSHSPAEWTDWHDITNGANLLLNVLLEVAGVALPAPRP